MPNVSSVEYHGQFQADLLEMRVSLRRNADFEACSKLRNYARVRRGISGPSDPNGSLEASFVELETSSVRHGIWGKIQLRFSGGGGETGNLGYKEGGTSASSSTGTRSWEESGWSVRAPPAKAPPILPKEIPIGQSPPAKPPPVLPKYMQHVSDTNANLGSGETQHPGKARQHGCEKIQEEKLQLGVPQRCSSGRRSYGDFIKKYDNGEGLWRVFITAYVIGICLA